MSRTTVSLTTLPSPSRSDSDSSANLLFLTMEVTILNTGCHTQHSIACRAASEENLKMNPQGTSYCSYWVLALSRVHHYLGHLLDLRKVAALLRMGRDQMTQRGQAYWALPFHNGCRQGPRLGNFRYEEDLAVFQSMSTWFIQSRNRVHHVYILFHTYIPVHPSICFIVEKSCRKS